MSYEFFYPGTPYSLEPDSGQLFTGYRAFFKDLGAPTSIQTANQIQEVSNLLNQGGKVIELQPISPEIFDAIPKQHFKEINRLTKLTGAETTVHAPMIDPSGFSKEGWSEVGREEAERQIKSIVERSYELSPDGRMPVTIHASAVPGTEYSKPSDEMTKDYKKQFEKTYGREPKAEELKQLEESQIIMINQETGQLVPLKREEKYYPETGKRLRVPQQEMGMLNNSEWVNNITNLAFYKKEADEVIGSAQLSLMPLLEKKPGEITYEDLEAHGGAISNLKRADLFLDNIETSFRNLYSKAYKYGDETGRKVLDNIAKDWKEQAKEQRKMMELVEQTGGKAPDLIKLESELIIKKSNLISNTLEKLRGLENHPPVVYKKVEDFATEKAAETLGNAAFSAYQKFGEKMPILSVENLYSGMAFSRSDELKNLIEEARKKFIENAKKKGISEGAARDTANKVIGVTWDVGHLNMLRKGGFNEEDLLKETEKIAQYVKHVHLTDNFGYADTHLSPGMGNVPIKDILKELEKTGEKTKKIVEAGGFVQHFKASPTPYVLEALGSPLYSMMAQPYWNQIVSSYGNYFGLPLSYMPEQHFSIYGGGFSSLPAELGGQMPGKQSRMTGTPME